MNSNVKVMDNAIWMVLNVFGMSKKVNVLKRHVRMVQNLLYLIRNVKDICRIVKKEDVD